MHSVFPNNRSNVVVVDVVVAVVYHVTIVASVQCTWVVKRSFGRPMIIGYLLRTAMSLLFICNYANAYFVRGTFVIL